MNIIEVKKSMFAGLLQSLPSLGGLELVKYINYHSCTYGMMKISQNLKKNRKKFK